MKDRLIENEIRSVETDFNREKKFVLIKGSLEKLK